MRSLARFGLGLCGLVLLGSPLARAQYAAPAANAAPPAYAQPSAHQHKGLFSGRHCVECQRAWAKKRDGVDVPPPPAMMPPGVMPGQVIHEHPQSVSCAACQQGTIITGPVTVVESYPAGHASVGGPMMAGNTPPGYAVVGGPGGPLMVGADPAPVGVSRAGMAQAGGPRVAAAPRPGAGPYDPSVLPTSTIPAQTALAGASGGRPHVLSHMLGIGGMSRHRKEARADRKREAHAAISYDPPAQNVSELPASMVYGRGRGH